MEIPSLVDLIKDREVYFVHYNDGELIYRTDTGFEFPVPLHDVGSGIFKAKDKAMFFMRWIRKQREVLLDYQKEIEAS